MEYLKFRVWDNKERVMIDYLTLMQTAWNSNSQTPILHRVLEDNIRYVKLPSTGVRDKNGREIFEGDILQYDDNEQMSNWTCGEIAVIEYVPARFRARMTRYGDGLGSSNVLTEEFQDCVEVIGNRYENADLVPSPISET